MPLTADMLDRDLSAIFADFPQTVEFRRPGKRPLSVPCASTESGGNGTAGEGGAGTLYDDSVQVTVRSAGLAWIPACGDAAVLAGSPRPLRVAGVRRVPGDAALLITLEVR